MENNREYQLSGYGYDAAGNMTSDPTDGLTNSYDAENRIATATKSGVTTSYLYDADGNRVQKTGGGASTLYWYMTPGIVAESDSPATLNQSTCSSRARRPKGLSDECRFLLFLRSS